MVYLKYNSVKLPVLDNYNIAKSSQEITFSDLKCDFTGHQKADLPEKYQEVRVVEESKVNREIEKIEYEEKKDVKELSFESKVKEKISICKVHGYSSQETREESKSTVTGTKVTVNDTYINNQTKFNIDGNSYQGENPSPDYPQEITNVGGYNNLFDKNNIINGSYVSDSNGAFIGNSTSKRTDYIEIQANSYYYIYSDKPSGNWGAWYDKDKKFISGITLGSKKEGVVNSPANAKYIAFTVSYRGNLTDYSNIKINETAIKIKQSGKNKLDFKKILKNANVTYTEQDGVFNLANNGNLYSVPYKLNLKPNTTYTIYQNFQEQNSTNVRLTIARGSNYEKVVESYSTSETESYRKKTFTTDESSDYYIRGDWSLLYFPLIYNEPILVEGTDDVSYEPYHEPKITPINLQGNILSKMRDVKDILRVNRNGEVEIKKNIGKVVLTGEEVLIDNSSTSIRKWWGINFSNYGIYQYNDPTKVCDVLTTKFKPRQQQGTFLPKQVALITKNKNMYFVFEPDTTEEQARAILTDMPVYFRLAEPQTIKLSSISPIELWQGTNIFSLVTNLDTEIELEYNYIPQSPSPEAPSEIKNVKDNINIKIADKNNEEQQEILFPLVQGQKLMQGDYLADDGIHHTKTQIQLDGITRGLKVESVTKHSNDIYYCVIKIIKQGVNGTNNMYSTHFTPYFGVKTGSCYITGYGGFIVLVLTDQSITTVDAANTWLAAQKEKGTPVMIEYELAQEEIETHTKEQQKAWNNMQNLVSYVGINNINSSTNIDVKYPVRIKKEIVPETYDKLLYTGYIDDYVFDEMRELDEDINISFTLLSPQKIATLRTCIAVGTYEIKDLIENIILAPLIDDGFTLKEINIVNKSLTVNFLVETVEYCMNNLSNKYNFWWYIDENKNIYVKDIETMFKEEPMYIYDDKHTIDGLEYVKPITNSYDYANVINFKNVRIYEYSRLRMNKKEVAEAHNPLIDGQVTNIKQNDQITFNFPIDIKKENIIKSANSNGITNTNIIYGIYVEGTYEDNTDFSFFVSFDTLNNLYKISDNLGFDGESTDSEKEFLLMRDSFFSNLITGIKYNNGNKKINSIKAINSDSTLIYNVNKFLNDKGILEKKNIISKTGIVERTIDMKESWKTVQELTEIGASYLNKNSLNYADELEIKLDKDKFQVGKILYINKFMIDGRYVVTEIQRTDQNNDDEFLVKCKNANILDNFIDIFRQENEQTSSDKVYQLYVTHYEEEGISERFEVVQ